MGNCRQAEVSAKLKSTDAMARKIASALVEDLGLGHLYNGDPRSWAMQYTPLEASAFKKHYQIVDLLKKYRFEEDVYTPDEVREMSIKKFMDNQQRLNNHRLELDPLVRETIFRARGWIDGLLGDYDLDEHLRHCYWPKKASVGVPQRKATLENRWLMEVTGSVAHLDWFDHIYLPWFGHAEGIRSQLDLVVCEHLSAVLVSKTYKSLRMIVPNTSVGGLYTNGLGAVMVKRLASKGYDVRVLPEQHKLFAQEASKTGQSATVDQSMASDNIVTRLIELTFPLRWAKALLFGRIDVLDIDGECFNTRTTSTMGIGYTFPMQMVLFLGLAHALVDIWEDDNGPVACRRVSCFGDDLICPVEIIPSLLHVFRCLGLALNAEKSYWSGPFRESCGGDYFRGYDVRPAYLPEGGLLSDKGYEVWLYKAFNALTRRWSLDELPLTTSLIIAALREVRSEPLCVPGSYAADAGLILTLEEIERLNLRRPHRDIHGTFTFSRMRKQTALVEVKNHVFYLWESYRKSSLHDPSTRPRWSSFVDHRFLRAKGHLLGDLLRRGLASLEALDGVQCFEAISKQSGEELVPLKRSVVRAAHPGLPGVHAAFRQQLFMGPPRYALSRRDKGEVKEDDVGTAVRLDDGVARYAVTQAKTVAWE